jgi:hypothetical protein
MTDAIVIGTLVYKLSGDLRAKYLVNTHLLQFVTSSQVMLTWQLNVII